MMRQSVWALLLMTAAVPARAADDAKPNTLTPKEIADGWILLWDGESTFGWTTPTDSKWTIAKGMIAPQKGKPGLLVTTAEFGECELKMQFQLATDSKPQLILGSDQQGRNPGTGLVHSLRDLLPSGGGWKQLTLRRTRQGNSFTTESLGPFGGGLGKKSSGPNNVVPGHIALSGNGLVIRNIKLKPLNTKPLLNGKDLTGWKEFPGKKSKFSVTKEGWLNLKNGPGDLQTTGLYDDFILQLDCISNGKHLNSGVFFRCQPDKYQQGYEAQIHNGFTAEPKKEYKIEEYDPKTNKLKDTKKVKYTAIDYGTGGIYNRMPARREVAKDHEWFTMTIAAHGRHMAVWVNGIQVTDWTDNRPPKDNARNGCRLEKGAISLQGHDPTTDLSFRNIRIAELPRK
jgi:hypothetical protein